MFTRENTKQVKGIAILLMLAHHLYTFADRIPYGLEIASQYDISGMELTVIIGSFGKICVSIFMFLGGYGLYASCSSGLSGGYLPPGLLSRHIIKLYKAYWKVFIIFIPIGFLFFGNQVQYCEADLCSKFADFKFRDFISSFIAYGNAYNGEWWFFKTYLFALFEGFVFIEVFKNNRNGYSEIAAVIIWHIVIACICPTLTSLEVWGRLKSDAWFSNLFTISDYASVFFVGIVFAKYDIFKAWSKLSKNITKLENIILSMIICVFCVYTRVFITPPSYDLLLAPVFVYAVLNIVSLLPLAGKILSFFGKNSTNMWLTHSFFCYYFYTFVKIVYSSRNAIISFIMLLGLSLGTSILLDFFWNIVHCYYLKARQNLITDVTGCGAGKNG